MTEKQLNRVKFITSLCAALIGAKLMAEHNAALTITSLIVLPIIVYLLCELYDDLWSL